MLEALILGRSAMHNSGVSGVQLFFILNKPSMVNNELAVALIVHFFFFNCLYPKGDPRGLLIYIFLCS